MSEPTEDQKEALLYRRDDLIGNVNQYTRELEALDEKADEIKQYLQEAEQELSEFNTVNPGLAN